MEKSMNEFTYWHLVIEGNAYEVGKAQGEYLKRYKPEAIPFFTEGNDFIRPVSAVQIEATMRLIDRYCPHLNEEIKGFADSLGILPEKVIYYSFSNVNKGQCSHFAILPGRTENKHFYVGRSYEWNTDDDLTLMTIKENGLYANMGFSLLLFGRFDGMNEHGFCVTMSNAVPCIIPEEEGFRFWVVIRILLEKCKTVDEAIIMLDELPLSAYCNLILADSLNNAVLAEINHKTKSYKRISPETDETFLCSTNHYSLPEMQVYVKNKMQHSMDRYLAMERKLQGDTMLNKEDLRNILSKHMPEGLACHYYNEGLGTLWSILYDITDKKATLCFGSPVVNKWYTIDLNTPSGAYCFSAKLPFENPDPKIWAQL